MAFEGCSDFTITGEQVSNVHGSQTNIRHLHGNLVLSAQQTRREQTRWDDYRHIQPGDTYLTRPLASGTEVERDEECITEKEFRRKDALIPLSCVTLNNNICSPLLYAYFEHQLTLWKPGEMINIADLWIDPRSGELRLGPHVQIPLYESRMILSYPSNSIFIGQLLPLSIQTYSNMGTTFDYLTRTVHAIVITSGITRSFRTFWQKLTDEDAGFIPQTLSGTVFHRPSQKAIARMPVKVRDTTHYYFCTADISPNAMRESLYVIEDGSVQFTVMPMDIQCVEEMTLRYSLSSLATLISLWSTQAHRVFTQLGIDEDEWDKYSVYARLDLTFKCKRQHPMPQENTSITSGSSGAGPVYLFIQPIPQPSENKEVWRSWAEGTKYFWSSDPSGKEEMSEAMQLSLGLPSFTSEVRFLYAYWDQSVYEAIKMIHHYHHFDPSTIDLAGLFGYSILEVVGDDDQFETWDSTEMTSTSDSGESDGPTLDTRIKRMMMFKTGPVKKILQCWKKWKKRMRLMHVNKESDMEVDGFSHMDS
uniref:Uncharacterized protein n=2 Tax=Moniliophthora roreri TaxID=221103 RepID=A0A0W0G5L0_MONRR